MADPRSQARLLRGLRPQDRARLRSACNFAREHLSGVARRSGENYAFHGEEVAEVLREISADASLLSVAVLHDLSMHPQGEKLLQASPLTPDERSRVQSMQSLRHLRIDASTDDLDLVITSFLDDPVLLPLRMAHRLNDVRHLDRLPEEMQRGIATESLHMYAAIAGRLGMHRWRSDMEDRCFRTLYPTEYAALRQEFARMKEIDETCMSHARRYLLQAMRKRGIHCRIDTRIKGVYSTYRKMIVKQRPFKDLTDRLAVRIITKEKDDCYRALGVVHECLHLMPGKLKDYIGAPKENGYRSIHTIVYPLPGVTELPIELQIRTEDMHRECEFGIAAHGDYKNAAYALESLPSRVNLFKNLATLRGEARTPKQFASMLRTYFREDHVAVFDTRSNLYHLKKPATALDFICLAFEQRLARLRAVRINGRERSLDSALRDGDTVEAVFGRARGASEAWTRAVMHEHSKTLIKQLLQGNRKPTIVEA
jgi:(p)ppGpp synthase/HD superfamily hydrolase